LWKKFQEGVNSETGLFFSTGFFVFYENKSLNKNYEKEKGEIFLSD